MALVIDIILLIGAISLGGLLGRAYRNRRRGQRWSGSALFRPT